MGDRNFEELRKLKIGQKYTLVSFGEFGFLYQIQFILKEIRLVPYAQYPESFWLRVRAERKRSDIELRFYGVKRFVVWEGFIYPKTDMFGPPEDRGNGVTCRKSWPCFDPRYFRRAISSSCQAPFIYNLTVDEMLEPAGVVGVDAQ